MQGHKSCISDGPFAQRVYGSFILCLNEERGQQHPANRDLMQERAQEILRVTTEGHPKDDSCEAGGTGHQCTLK